MIIDGPRDIAALRSLWQEAFGDTDSFLDCFFATGFAPERCRCLYLDGKLAAALYWFDCAWQGKKLAYLYGIATDASFRGRGLCRRLMTQTHTDLKAAGYHGCVLVPATDALFSLYEKLGYATCGYVREFTAAAGSEPLALRCLDPAEYASLRRSFLPENAVLQEDAALRFLHSYAGLYAGENCLAAVYGEEGRLTACEFLGDPAQAPGLLKTLGYCAGFFRTPGNGRPYCMYLSLSKNTATPGYFGLALD